MECFALCKWDRNESDDVQHSDQKPFASVFLLCVRVPLAARRWEELRSYRKTRRVPFSLKYSHSDDQPDYVSVPFLFN